MSIGAYGNQLECSVHLSVAADRVFLQHNAKWRHWPRQIEACNVSCETLLTKGAKWTSGNEVCQYRFGGCAFGLLCQHSSANDFPSWLSVRPSFSAFGNGRLPPRSTGHYTRRLRKAVDFMLLNRPSGSSVQLIPKTTLNNYPEPAASTSRPHSMFE
jgi:hypothetical protein